MNDPGPEARADRAALLFELSKSAYVDSGYFEIAAEHIALAAARGLLIPQASVWRLVPERGIMKCAALVYQGEVLPAAESLEVRHDELPVYFETMLAQRLVAAEDVPVGVLSRGLPHHRPGETGVLLGAPFSYEGRVAGVICCQGVAGRKWSGDDEHFLHALVEIAARALGAEARQHAEDALHAAHTGIEATVAERTHALRLALHQLQQAQEQLVQTEKLAALGALVAGVAHEINTPLGISVTATSHLRTTVADIRRASAEGKLTREAFETFLASSQEGVDILSRNLERAAQLVQSFKRVAVHQGESILSDFSLRTALQDLLRSLSPECRRAGIACHLDCPDDIVMRADNGALDQVVTNLVMNALRHAFNGRTGEIHVRASGGINESGMISLEVADNGAGIEADLLPRIFDPFVTTRRNDGGTGLGLHIVQNLVRYRLKGMITVSSLPDVGSTFEVRIPANAEPGPVPLSPPETEPAQIFPAAKVG